VVFFDRDGIINSRIMNGYVTDVDDFVLLPESTHLLRLVKERGWLAIVVTNQQGIGKGLMTEDDLASIHEYMQRELRTATGFVFDDILFAGELDANRFKDCCGEVYCPPQQQRRKPSPAMLLEAQERWQISNDDMQRSWMIGDSLSDAQAGAAAGVQCVLVGDFAAVAADVPPTTVIVRTLHEAYQCLHSALQMQQAQQTPVAERYDVA